MDTVAKAGWLSRPMLSVTTSEKVTVPEVLGTVTETFDVGAVTVVDGFADDNATVALPGPEGAGVGIGGIMIEARGSTPAAFVGFGMTVDEWVEFSM